MPAEQAVVARAHKAAGIHRVAIIGAGAGGAVSGPLLASLCGRAGFAVTLEDVLPGNLRRADQAIRELFPSSPDDALPRYASSIEDAVRDADLVLDTVPDELESKLEILTLLDRMAPPAALFATPTEVLSIADLASCTYRPGQCFGLRFVSLEPLHIALSYPAAATATTVVRMKQFLHALGAVTEILEDRQPLP